MKRNTTPPFSSVVGRTKNEWSFGDSAAEGLDGA
jgi:hypothetical protein